MIKLFTRLFRRFRNPFRATELVAQLDAINRNQRVTVHRVVNKPTNYNAAREAMTARLRGEVEAMKGAMK